MSYIKTYANNFYNKLVRSFYESIFKKFFRIMIIEMIENHEEKLDSFITMDCDDFIINELLNIANDISTCKMNDRVQDNNDFVKIANFAGMYFLRNCGTELITKKDFVENFLKACKIGLDDGENR